MESSDAQGKVKIIDVAQVLRDWGRLETLTMKESNEVGGGCERRIVGIELELAVEAKPASPGRAVLESE